MPPDELLRRVNALRKTDNCTSWFYLLREYLFLGSMVGLTLVFYHAVYLGRISGWYALPVTLFSAVLIGAGQHRLTTLGHEASHYLLFRHRILNEMVSDWLCMFPMWSTTHHYRLQHLAHHQFPNDPQRDPDVLQMEGSGHRFRFPLSPVRFVWQCVVKQGFWLPGLIRYIRWRARYATTGGGDGPYGDNNPRANRLVRIAALYVLGSAALMTGLTMWGRTGPLIWVPAGLWFAVTMFFAVVPRRFYRNPRLKPDVPLRWITCGRLTYITLLFVTLAWLCQWTGEPWGLYYLAVWFVPMLTGFSFCMIARQIVQHGHAGRGRFDNTRVFLVGRLIRWAVFPLGMDYHLPHHLFPLVPHYRLPRLHALLLEHSPDYEERCTVVEGYFFHRRPPRHTTVLELMAGERGCVSAPCAVHGALTQPRSPAHGR